ncbi:MAG TPA: hypothetical protein VF176_01215 [Solirubrobacterales bacterium]
MSLPDDANDLRGVHFKHLIGRQTTWLAITVAVVAAGVAGTAFLSPAVGAAAAVGAFLIVLIVIFAIADSRAEDDFFAVYAQQRGLQLSGRSRLPAATPLLRKGDDRYAERLLSGPLADGVDGMLALFTYEDETTDSEGNRQTNYYRYTVGLIEVPECAGGVPELYCQRKSGLRALEKFEDVFRGSKERVKLESEALDDKYEIFAREGQDANWLRQLFSPTFIVWLTDSAPKKFAFELVDGTLCCYVNGHKENAEALDVVCQASAAVATRLREEASESRV